MDGCGSSEVRRKKTHDTLSFTCLLPFYGLEGDDYRGSYVSPRDPTHTDCPGVPNATVIVCLGQPVARNSQGSEREGFCPYHGGIRRSEARQSARKPGGYPLRRHCNRRIRRMRRPPGVPRRPSSFWPSRREVHLPKRSSRRRSVSLGAEWAGEKLAGNG